MAHITNGTSSHSNGVNGTDQLSSTSAKAWGSPGPAEFDFRSDVTTTPTASMLTAISNCSLLDDVFLEDQTTSSLEAFIADLTSHEAALLVLSGTMGNQISLRTHLAQPPHSILADAKSHILGWEAGGIASLSGALAVPVTPANEKYITLEDVKKHAILSNDVHACPTKVISLENTLGGVILPLETCQQISTWARSQSPPLLLHLDGARLWEAVAVGAGSLKDYCSCFDSVSLCFSKGLGAPIGSIIVGEKSFIDRARHIRKGLGGGLRQAGVISAAARTAVEETFLGGALTGAQERAKEVADLWTEKGGKLSRDCETNMVWCDLEAPGIEAERWVEAGVREGLKVHKSGRCVVHYQISAAAVERLGRVMDAVLGTGRIGEEDGLHGGKVRKGVKRKAEEIGEVEVE